MGAFCLARASDNGDKTSPVRAEHQKIRRGAVNSPRRLSRPLMTRQSPAESTDAFCASVATTQRAAGKTLSDSLTGLAGLIKTAARVPRQARRHIPCRLATTAGGVQVYGGP